MPAVELLIKPASGLCNLRCDYCFYSDVAKHRQEAGYGRMSDETLTHLVKKALAYADGQCTFAFQGGEPTLAGLNFYRRLVDLQKRYNYKHIQIANSIQTNGTLIDEEWAKFLSDHHFLVGLSLDGPREIHNSLRKDAAGQGSFDRVMETVRLFNRYGVEYNILAVINANVARHGKQVYSFFRSCNFKYLQLIECLDPLDCQPRDYSLDAPLLEQFWKDTFDEYYKDFQRGHYISVRTFDNYVARLLGRPPEACGMQGHCSAYYLVEANGNVYPCDFYVLDRYLMGNLHTHSFEELARSPAAREFVRESLPVADDCRRCRWYPLCHGGCRRHREPFTAGVPGLNRFCAAYKGFFDYAYPRMESMARTILRKQQGQ